GVSPMQYLRNARYAKIRGDLVRADGEAGVTEVALRWGITHMGRFSIEYRRRFGESPSQTLGRRRNSDTPRARN
ncbi:MAG TPA: helix-turn-helix domain-containing protein, partial [Alphaproteobacteria bacterium]|nr:helix-turn-helix domain-containing protein [Alphaproteobacteria bacterium]